jgi:hypothetical protein
MSTTVTVYCKIGINSDKHPNRAYECENQTKKWKKHVSNSGTPGIRTISLFYRHRQILANLEILWLPALWGFVGAEKAI